MSNIVSFQRDPTVAEVEVEQSVIAMLMAGAETAWLVLDRIDTSDMIEPLHQRIVEAVRRILSSSTEDPDPLTIAAVLASDKGLDEVGGTEYLLGIQRRLGRNRRLAPQLCDALIDHNQRRTLAYQIARTEHRLGDLETPASDIVAEHQAALQELQEGRAQPEDPVSWYDAGREVTDRIEAPAELGERLTRFGIPKLDAEIGGMAPGDLVIMAGRPGMGKTAVALNIGHAVARPRTQLSLDDFAEKVTPGTGVYMISMEMKKRELLERGLSMRARQQGKRVQYKNIHLGRIKSDADKQAIADALYDDTNTPFFIDQKPGQTIGQIAVRARRMKARMKRDGIEMGLIIIDHLGLIESDNNRGWGETNRVVELTLITRTLKKLAANLMVPILCLCQLNRGVEAREDKRPFVSDLRDSGSIEQDADIILLLYRAEYYLAKSQPPEEATEKKRTDWATVMEKARGKISIHAAKNRHGAECEVSLRCELAYNWIGED